MGSGSGSGHAAFLDVVGRDMSLSFTRTLGLKFLGGQVTGVKVLDAGDVCRARGGLGATQQEGAFDDFPALELPVLLDDLSV